MRWSHLLLLLIAAVTTAVTADSPPSQAANTWNLKFSDPTREGRFLNVPIQYGEWVPINRARALVENIASKISQQDTLVAPPNDRAADQAASDDLLDLEEVDSANDRSDHGNVVYVQNQRPANQRSPPPPQQQQQANRRQDASFAPFRFPNQPPPPPPQPPANRGQRKLPPPSSANSVTNGNANNAQFRQKPAPQQQPAASNNQFGFIPAAFNSFNPFAFFQSESETKPQQQQPQGQPQQQQQQQFASPPSYPTKRPPVPPQQPVPQQPASNNNNNRNNIVNTINDYSAYLESLNAIQTIPAPDLTKIGPPVIELDTKDGQIVVGQPFSHHQDRDHLAGFVSLDFDGFASGGDLENNGGDKTKAHKGSDNTDKLSLIVGGNNPSLFTNAADFEADLVNLLNGKDDAELPATFLLGGDKAPPAGFAKLDLPFMDPTEHKGKLPKVFIAPVGKPIPKGYKGKPLPADGSSLQEPSSTSGPSTTETVLVVESSSVAESSVGEQSTSPSSTQQQQKGVTANSAFRFKLQKERPSLSQFYLKNKKDKFEELKQLKKQQQQPEKLEKFYPKSRVEDVVSKDQQQQLLPAVVEEPATAGSPLDPLNQLVQELIQFDTDSDAPVFLPPLTTAASSQEQPAAQTEPQQLQQHLHISETTTSVAPAAAFTEYAAADHEPIVQSTLEQHQWPIQEHEQQQLIESEQQQQQAEAEATASSTLLPEVVEASSSFIPSATEQPAEITTTTSSVAAEAVLVLTTTSSYSAPETTQFNVVSDGTVALAITTTAAAPNRKVAKTTQDPFVRLEALRKQKQEQLAPVFTQQPTQASSSTYPVDLDTSEDEVVSEDTAIPSSEASRPKTRLRLRKYGGAEAAVEAEDTQAAAPAPTKKFGKRIRTRKRPAFWPSRLGSGGEEGGIEPTVRPGGPLVLRQKLIGGISEPTAATALEALKTEDYKKKFRPFFDQLYSQLSKSSEEEVAAAEAGSEAAAEVASVTDGPAAPRRVGVPRKRSTTPQPPITVDAEIYEVHPQTRLRITTRTPRTTQTTTLLPPALQDSEDYDGNGSEEETTLPAHLSDVRLAPAASTTTLAAVEDIRDSSTEAVEENGALFGEEIFATEFSVSSTVASTEQRTETTASIPAVHETADKHSTISPSHLGPSPLEAALEAANEAVEELASSIDLDVQNEIGVDQDFEESQQVQQAWNDLLATSDKEEDGKAVEDVVEEQQLAEEKVDNGEEEEEEVLDVQEPAVVSTPNSRLTSYEKNIDPSLFGGEFSSSSAFDESAVSTVNEHGQQQVDAAAVVNADDDETINDVETEDDITSQRPELIGSDGGWFPLKQYVEIDRSAPKPTATIEEVPITESKDYSDPDIFYDVNKDGFEDSKDEYSIPVSVKLAVPEAAATTVVAAQTTVVSNPTTPSAIVEETTAAVVVAAAAEAQATTDVVDSNAVVPTTTTFSNPSTSAAAIGLTTTAFVQPATAVPTTAAVVGLSTEAPNPLYQDSTTLRQQQQTEIFNVASQPLEELQGPATDATGFEVIHIGPPAAAATTDNTAPTAEPLNSAHKIPNSLWSVFENSREQEEASTAAAAVASATAAATAAEEAATSSNVVVVKTEDLPKPDEHTSEVLLIEEVPTEVSSSSSSSDLVDEIIEEVEDEDGHKLPKAFDFGLLADAQSVVGDVQIHSFGLEQSQRKEGEGVAKKREDWIKTWVARKFNKPKFPRGPVPIISASTSQADTTAVPTELFANNNEVIDINSKSPNGFFSAAGAAAASLFAPTIPPLLLADPTLSAATAAKTSPRFNVNLDVTVRDGGSEERTSLSTTSTSSSSSSAVSSPLVNVAGNANGEYKSSLLEKYSRNKIKTGIFHNNNNNKAAENAGGAVSNNSSSSRGVYEAAAAAPAAPSYVVGGVPLGANKDIHRSYGGKQLSMADFESQILGVSSATEISVKSMICVKGRCFNADEMGGKLIS